MKNENKSSAIKGVIGSAVAALALLGAGAAVAGTPVAKSEVTLTEKNFNFKGKVSSDSHVCEARRQVLVYRIVNGNDILVGGDKTDNSGSYKFDVNVINGADKHFAVAQLKETDKVTCKEAESQKFVPADTP